MKNGNLSRLHASPKFPLYLNWDSRTHFQKCNLGFMGFHFLVTQSTRVAQDCSPHLRHLCDGLRMVARATSEQCAPLASQNATALGISPQGGKLTHRAPFKQVPEYIYIYIMGSIRGRIINFVTPSSSLLNIC